MTEKKDFDWWSMGVEMRLLLLVLLLAVASCTTDKRAMAEAVWCAMSVEDQARAVRELGATPQKCPR